MTSVKIDPELARLIERADALDKSGVDLSARAGKALEKLEAPLVSTVPVKQGSVKEVFATMDAAQKAGDVEAFFACFTEVARKTLPFDVEKPNGRAMGRTFLDLLGSMTLGKCLEDGADRKVFEFKSELSTSPQVFVRIDGKWFADS